MIRQSTLNSPLKSPVPGVSIRPPWDIGQPNHTYMLSSYYKVTHYSEVISMKACCQVFAIIIISMYVVMYFILQLFIKCYLIIFVCLINCFNASAHHLEQLCNCFYYLSSITFEASSIHHFATLPFLKGGSSFHSCFSTQRGNVCISHTNALCL